MSSVLPLPLAGAAMTAAMAERPRLTAQQLCSQGNLSEGNEVPDGRAAHGDVLDPYVTDNVYPVMKPLACFFQKLNGTFAAFAVGIVMADNNFFRVYPFTYDIFNIKN